jgi:hypothetical protein
MIGAVFVYCLCVFSGAVLERRLSINNLLKRTILVFSVGAAQLTLTIELLSIWKGLDELSLALATTILSGGLVVLFGWRRPSPQRVSWRTLLENARLELRRETKDPWSAALVLTGIGLFIAAGTAGWLILPLNDLYHFEMPRFWIQRHTILPFPVNDPRVVTLSFLSETLQFPAYLYLHVERAAEVLAIIGGLFALWSVFSLARRAGAGFAASCCASGIAVGYTSFALDIFHASAEMLLAGALFGGCLLFLMDAYANRATIPLPKADLACSIFLFLMACGAKNSTMLIAPVYLAFLAWVIKAGVAQLQKGTQTGTPESAGPSDTKMRGQQTSLAALIKLAPWLISCGVAGLLCSGVAWNYASNKLWFGRAGLPPVIRTTVSTDFHPRAIWTRICRGAVLMAYDTTWVPKSARGKYAWLCKQTVKVLGGQAKLSEDDHYYAFNEETITPLKGLGLMGIVFFIPGLVLASAQLVSGNGFNPGVYSTAAFSKAMLSGLAIGSFVMCHLVLHWQAIGLLRLMFPCVIAGAPLAAFVLEKRWTRIPALLLLFLSSTMFLTFWVGQISRRMGWSERPSLQFLARLQNNHTATVRYQWKGQAPAQFQQREDYSYREVYAKLLEGLHRPCALGFVGNANQQCLELFGADSKNKVVPLVDSRNENDLIDPPSDLQYIVAVDKFSELDNWAKLHGFEEIFSCSDQKGALLRAFGRVSVSTARAQGNALAPMQAR